MRTRYTTLRYVLPALAGALAVTGAVACSSSAGSADSSSAASTSSSTRLELTNTQRATVVEKKATCPFVGTALAIKKLFTFNTPDRPLALIEGPGSVVALGDTGGGDLGSKVLKLFATGNHHFMRGPDSTTLDTEVPAGTFSLDFPGSQGAHPGHSGILVGDPTRIDSGHFSAQDFARLVSDKPDEPGCTSVGHAELDDGGNRVIRRSEIGKFIAENLKRDPKSKVFGSGVSKMLGTDLKDFVDTVGPALKEHLLNDLTGSKETPEEDQLAIALTKSLGEDNLVGSSGEFGLLMAFLANSPKTVTIDGEPAISVDDVTLMFATPEGGSAADRRLPEGWETWKKTQFDWVLNTTFLMHAAAVEYVRLQNDCGG